MNPESTSWKTPEISVLETTELMEEKPIAKALDDACFWYRKYYMYVLLVLGSVLCACGLLGNALLRLALWSERRKSATVFLLICLSVVDDLVMTSYGFMLMGLLVTNLDSVQETDFPKYYTRALTVGWAVASTFQVAATWLLLLVSVHRFIAICKPTLSKNSNSTKLARNSVLAVAGSSVAFNLPRFFKYEMATNPWTGKETAIVTAFASTESFRVGYELIAYYVLVYLVPLSILIYTSSKLLIALRQSKKKRAAMISKAQDSTTSKLQEELTRSVVVVVVVFCICQLANPIRRLLEEVLPASEKVCGSVYSFYSPLSGLFVIFNSAVNFFVLCACAGGFRKQLGIRLSRQHRVHTQQGPST